MSDNEKPSQGNGYSEQHEDYLAKAAEACAEGDLVLGMHLYLAAYEKAAADPSVPDGMALAGLREAWHLACDLKERSMAEYVFEKLEPYLMPNEIAECAAQLQDLALDRLEQIGFSREELQDVAEMITRDLVGNGATASVVKVESMSIPNAEMFGVPGVQVESVTLRAEGPDDEVPGEPAYSAGEPHGADTVDVAESTAQPKDRKKTTAPQMDLASVDDFNPYDMYRDYSIGKSWHVATNEGSGAEVFTRDQERADAHEQFVEQGGAEALAETAQKAREEREAAAKDAAASPSPASPVQPSPDEPESQTDVATAEDGEALQTAPQASAPNGLPAMPDTPELPLRTTGYRGLVGYDDAISIMRDFGVGLQHDRAYLSFVSMLNEQHGLDRAPALDTILFRAPVIEDAARFAEATIEELGLPSLRMSIEESVMGMPVLCVTTQGNNRPRMNHAHNRFEAPAILVIEDLDLWSVPEIPEATEGGMNAFIMANLSRGAREAINLIRASVEDPDVYVIATATTSGDVDPFYYDVLEPMTVVDIGMPTEKERADIWEQIAQAHPSIRQIDRADLVRYSEGVTRCDLYLAAREAIEEAYKFGLVQRSYVPVVPQNIFEKLAACQPLDSATYRDIEDEVIRSFKEDLEHLEDLIDGPGE